MIEIELNDHQARLVLNALMQYRAWLEADSEAIRDVNDNGFERGGEPEVSGVSVALVADAVREVETIIEILRR